MLYVQHGLIVGLILLMTGVAWAGGSNYGITPGSRPQLAGKMTEWQVPTPKFARDPAPGPDGNIYISVMHGNKIARFDTQAQTFHEWELPAGAQPHGLLVDRHGQVWYTGNGNGTIGRLDPVTGKVVEHKAPSEGGNRIGRLDTQTGSIREFKTAGHPYGLALDKTGSVWFCEIGAGKLGKLDPKTGTITELTLESGSQPRRMATAPDGSLWVTLYGTGKLLHVDPDAAKVIHAYVLPGGPKSGPYAVTVDGAGMVWANEFATDTLVHLDPQTGQMRTFPLPSKSVGVRKMIVDAEGRLWYMGSHNGRLGVLE